MTNRQSRGRQRIPMKRIENRDSLHASFSKRRLGIYKKVSELCTLCGVDIGLIIFHLKAFLIHSFLQQWKQVEELKNWLEYCLSQSSIRMEQLKKEASSSSTLPLENVPARGGS
ncbi:hypothetical protein ACJIZ3_023079 [Penstemon smallii]|uniref:MADS-box domain-containing protein n=1 Tax=Penstemon smallii TaxID=265156 RepID=A0ABD3TQZ4_9LAMI